MKDMMKASLSPQKKRLLKAEKNFLSLLVAGSAYAFFLERTGRGIPCLFRLATGKLCPGCGMSHAAMALLKGGPLSAFEWNALSVTVVPVLLLILLKYVIRYVCSESREFTAGETVLLSLLLMISIAYGIARNMS